jgi:predicted type IV restriction endonuclease
MPTIPSKVEQRIKDGLKRFGPILVAQRDRDVSEADTVTVVKDILSDVLGYDKYLEVTSEHAIRGTYCDLAIKLEGKLRLLIEVKAIGIQLAEKHTKQAVDYATNQGLDWVALTNGIRWMLYRIHFKKPIEAKLVAEFDLLSTDLKSESDLEKVYLISREGLIRGAVVEFSEKQNATSKYLIAALLLHDEDVLTGIRRELRKVTGILVEPAVIAEVLRNDIIKREALEGEEAIQSERRILKENRRGKEEPAPTAPAASPEPATTDASEIRQGETPLGAQ